MEGILRAEAERHLRRLLEKSRTGDVDLDQGGGTETQEKGMDFGYIFNTMFPFNPF